MTEQVSNWVAQLCSTVGGGPLTLGERLAGYASFSQSFAPQTRVYYSIEDGLYREAGIGTFNGYATITRDEVHMTLKDGIISKENPEPIMLSGGSVVRCTMNAEAYRAMLVDTGALNLHLIDVDNPHLVTKEQVGLGNVTDVDATPAIDHIALKSNPHDVKADQVPLDKCSKSYKYSNVQDAICGLGGELIQTQSQSDAPTTALLGEVQLTKASGTTINVSAGSARVIDNTDISNPVKSTYWWEDINGFDCSAFMYDNGVRFFDVAMDTSAGPGSPATIKILPEGITTREFRDFPLVGRVTYDDKIIRTTEVTGIYANNADYLLLDFINSARANVKTRGMASFPASDYALQFYVSKGSLLSPGVNYTVDRKDPNIKHIAGQGGPGIAAAFRMFYEDAQGTPVTEPDTNIVEKAYTNNGVVTPITGTEATIQYLFSTTTGNASYQNLYVLYGDSVYANKFEAIEKLAFDLGTRVFPAATEGFILLAQVLVSADAVYFDNDKAAIVNYGRF